jgi:single-strand DNA-binding protein
MNSVSFIGNLTKDAEYKEIVRKDTGEIVPVAKFRLAVDRIGKDAGADFLDIEVWGKQAQNVRDMTSKGSLVSVNGRAKFDSWEKEGQRYSRIIFVADLVRMVGPRRPLQTGAPDDGDVTVPVENEFAVAATGDKKAAEAPSADESDF